MLQATTPGKERTTNTGHVIPNYRANAIGVSIKPIADIYLDGPPEHDERCCVVWTPKGRRLIKFISKACPYHAKVECIRQAL